MLDTICEILKLSYKKGWISTRDGNASYRRKHEPYIYVTPSGVRKYNLNSEMMLKLHLPSTPISTDCLDVFKECERVSDEIQDKIIGLEPSGELMLHVLLQQILLENRVVLHLHPTHIVAAMYAGLDLQTLAAEFPEINRYTRVGPTVPIIPPISRELAIASVEKFNLNSATGEVEFDIIGLDRHGVIAIAKDAWSAFEHVERLSHICEMVLAAGSLKNKK